MPKPHDLVTPIRIPPISAKLAPGAECAVAPHNRVGIAVSYYWLRRFAGVTVAPVADPISA